VSWTTKHFNPLNTELNTNCHLLALLGAHLIFDVSGLRVNGEVELQNCYKQNGKAVT
jgi:hypothetical protein